MAGPPPATYRPLAGDDPERARLPWWRVFLRALGRSATNYAEDRGTQMAASISYFTLFSLFPLTLLAIAGFGIVLRDAALQERVLTAILGQIRIEERVIEDAMLRLVEVGPTLGLISLVGALWTAGAVSAAIRSALNVIFEVTQRRPFFRGKLIDYALIPIIGIPIFGSVVLTTVWRVLQEQIIDFAPFFDGPLRLAFEAGAVLIPLLLGFIAFLLMYWLLPNRPLRFRYLWPGALFAAVAWEALKYGFSFYLANFANYEALYGPLASVIVLLFFVFITANIMLFGAEVAAEIPHVLYAEPRHGRPQADEGNWRHSIWVVLRGLVLAGDEEETVDRRVGRSARREPAPPLPSGTAEADIAGAPSVAPEQRTR